MRGSWHSVWEPLALGYLYSYTKDLPNVEYIYMGDGAFDTESDIISHCADADIVGFSGTTSQMPWSVRIIEQIKARSPSTLCYVGGYGPSVSPDWFIDKVDGVVAGEGEVPWRDILQSGGKTRGMVVHPAISNLDSIPFPDRDFIKVERCIGVAKREEGRRVTGILGNRGCLRRCKFCADGSPKTIYGTKLRERSPSNIVDEMELVGERHDIEFFKFADPEVNTRPGRTRELCAELTRRGWKVPWGGNFLANPMDSEDARALYAAGCREAWIGLESGSLEIHKHIGKGVTPNLIRKAFQVTKEAGLLRRAYVLMGTPLETKETIRETEALIDEVRPDTVSFSILAPYPGTEYYQPEFADWDWEHIDEYGGNANQYHNLDRTKMNRTDLLAERLLLIEKYKGHLSGIMTKKIALGVIDTGEIALNDFETPKGDL